MSKNLQDLLDGAIFEGCGDAEVQNNTTDKCRTQLNLTRLHKLLCTIIDNQNALQITINDADERLANMETKLENSTNSSRKSSVASIINNKEVLPPLASTLKSVKK